MRKSTKPTESNKSQTKAATAPKLVEQPHPEDTIYKLKSFINTLTELQDKYFDRWAGRLKLTKRGQDYLFDYVYNCTKPVDFSEYLAGLGYTYEEMLQVNKPKKTVKEKSRKV